MCSEEKRNSTTDHLSTNPSKYHYTRLATAIITTNIDFFIPEIVFKKTSLLEFLRLINQAFEFDEFFD
jgi:hypothetical protein